MTLSIEQGQILIDSIDRRLQKKKVEIHNLKKYKKLISSFPFDQILILTDNKNQKIAEAIGISTIDLSINFGVYAIEKNYTGAQSITEEKYALKQSLYLSQLSYKIWTVELAPMAINWEALSRGYIDMAFKGDFKNG